MTELEIILLILCFVNSLGIVLLLLKKNNTKINDDLKQEVKDMSNDITLKLVAAQGELKEHLARQIGENNEKMLSLYTNFSTSLGQKLDKEQAELKEHLAKQIGENNEKMLKMYNDFSKELSEWLNKAIKELNEKVDSKLNEGFKKTNETFQGILERITKIDEADATLKAAINALSNELNATNEKVAELETFIIIVCVIAGVAFCGCGTLAVFYIIDKKKKI